MNLTLPQIRALMDGAEEIINIQKSSNDEAISNKKTVNDDKKQPKINDLGTMLSALGGSVNMTPKAKEALKKIANKKR